MVKAQVCRRGWKVRKAELEEGKKIEKEEGMEQEEEI
jgi:hypothetical protein